jgi:serine/threonine protein phosphatase PrpC
MEDAHIAVIGLKHSDELNIQNSALFCVFDGHGGKSTFY